ncbi:hypothetical protein MP228_003535 [Amoeboaphelidium protococcarum]|nr:hypothetical protein MP228_003535 [Amoeboaphelidium protococcarum]
MGILIAFLIFVVGASASSWPFMTESRDQNSLGHIKQWLEGSNCEFLGAKSAQTFDELYNNVHQLKTAWDGHAQQFQRMYPDLGGPVEKRVHELYSKFKSAFQPWNGPQEYQVAEFIIDSACSPLILRDYIQKTKGSWRLGQQQESLVRLAINKDDVPSLAVIAEEFPQIQLNDFRWSQEAAHECSSDVFRALQKHQNLPSINYNLQLFQAANESQCDPILKFLASKLTKEQYDYIAQHAHNQFYTLKNLIVHSRVIPDAIVSNTIMDSEQLEYNQIKKLLYLAHVRHSKQ